MMRWGIVIWEQSHLGTKSFGYSLVIWVQFEMVIWEQFKVFPNDLFKLYPNGLFTYCYFTKFLKLV